MTELENLFKRLEDKNTISFHATVEKGADLEKVAKTINKVLDHRDS